jgi:hypothetical protein
MEHESSAFSSRTCKFDIDRLQPADRWPDRGLLSPTAVKHARA